MRQAAKQRAAMQQAAMQRAPMQRAAMRRLARRRCGVRSRVFAWKKSRDLLSRAVALAKHGAELGEVSDPGKASAPADSSANPQDRRDQRRAGGWAPARTSGALPRDLRRATGPDAARSHPWQRRQRNVERPPWTIRRITSPHRGQGAPARP